MVKILERPEDQKPAMMDSSHERQSVGSATGSGANLSCGSVAKPVMALPARKPDSHLSRDFRNRTEAVSPRMRPVGSGLNVYDSRMRQESPISTVPADRRFAGPSRPGLHGTQG